MSGFLHRPKTFNAVSPLLALGFFPAVTRPDGLGNVLDVQVEGKSI